MSPAPYGRQVTDGFLIKLKALTRLLKQACGGQETSAMVTRVSHQTISRYCLIHEDGIREDCNFIPVDVAVDLMRFSHNFDLLRAMADECGFALVAKDRKSNGSELHEKTATLILTQAQVAASLHMALADNDVDAREARSILPGVDKLAESVLTIASDLKALANQEQSN